MYNFRLACCEFLFANCFWLTKEKLVIQYLYIFLLGRMANKTAKKRKNRVINGSLCLFVFTSKKFVERNILCIY